MICLTSSTLVAVIACLASADAQSFSVSVPTALPTSASNVVSREFFGYGIESGSFPDYTGSKSKPNTFSLNMFSALTKRLGTFPIRIGGDSMDVAQWVPSQSEAVTWPNGNKRGLMSFSNLGMPYLDGFSMIDGSRWILGLPFNRNNLTNSVAFAKAAYKSMPNGTFSAFELGNEVDLYPGDGRPKNYTENDYISQWIQWSDAITGNISLPEGPNFWTLSLSWAGPPAWSVKNAFTGTPNLSSVQKRVKAVSRHYYSTGAGSDIQSTLLNHPKERSQVNSNFEPAVQFLGNMTRPIPLALGEVAGAMGNGTPVHEIQSSLGTAVWQVDFLLTAMTLNIGSVNMQNINASGFSAWWPVAVNNTKTGAVGGPTVWASFYGQVMVADLFAQTLGDLQVAPLTVSPNSGAVGNGSIVAYSAYNTGKLNKVVLLDEQFWTTSSGGARPSNNVTVSGLSGFTSVRVDRLSGPSGDELHNVTWAGQQWTYENKGIPKTVNNDTTTVPIKNGAVTVNIPATSALMLTLLT